MFKDNMLQCLFPIAALFLRACMKLYIIYCYTYAQYFSLYHFQNNTLDILLFGQQMCLNLIQKIFNELISMIDTSNRKMKRCSKKECCKQCKHVKFKGTMTKRPV